MSNFDKYRMKGFEIEGVVFGKLLNELKSNRCISNSNFDNACIKNGCDSYNAHYWKGADDIIDEMIDILESVEHVDILEKRTSRMHGMLDACNMIIKMVEDEEFHNHCED
jgi:hypothetical protein